MKEEGRRAAPFSHPEFPKSAPAASPPAADRAPSALGTSNFQSLRAAQAETQKRT